jgi:hypothetical protein
MALAHPAQLPAHCAVQGVYQSGVRLELTLDNMALHRRAGCSMWMALKTSPRLFPADHRQGACYALKLPGHGDRDLFPEPLQSCDAGCDGRVGRKESHEAWLVTDA